MSAVKLIENRIARELIRQRSRVRDPSPGHAGRLITALAFGAGLILAGSYLQEMLWVLLGAAACLALGDT